MRLSLSVEDTNRLRAKLGLRLIPVGPETLVDHAAMPEERVKLLRNRIATAGQRAEERALHTAAVAGPTITSTPTESTKSWLDRIRLQKSSAGDTLTEVREDDAVAEAASETSIHHEQQSEAPATAGPLNSLKPIPQSFKTPNVGRAWQAPALVADPLDAPTPQKGKKRDQSADYERQTAVFKTKKLKLNSKSRQRTHDRVVSLNIALDEENEERALESILAKARASRSSEIPQNERKLAHEGKEFREEGLERVVENENALVIGSTQTFLSELRTADDGRSLQDLNSSRDAGDPAKHSKLSALNTEAMEAEALDRPALELEELSGPAVASSVSDTLKWLESTRRVNMSTYQAKASRREWMKRLQAQRLARGSDLQDDLDNVKHLPLQDRKRAIELRTKETCLLEADAAQDLFKDYTPDVSLDHRDERGNAISAKEAFKRLSGAFHGAKSH